MPQNRKEKVKAGELAALSAEIAAENIKKYIALHRPSSTQQVMKLADEMDVSISDQAEAAAAAAIQNLQKYLDMKKKGR
jgi:hypothetical protein